MYVRTREGLGHVVTAINLDRAVWLNRHYARLLGWQAHVRYILRILGFTTYVPNEKTFAEAVARWQRRQGLPVDGIIMPATWSRMLPAFKGRNLSRVYQLSRPSLEQAAKTRDDFLKDVRDKPSNFIFSDFLSGFAAPDEFLCTPSSTTRLNSFVVKGVTDTRRLAGERLPISSPACPATALCPPAFQLAHATGDATHFVSLDRNMIRVVELAGLFGVNLSGITGSSATRVARKASRAVKSLPSVPPLGGVSFVAIRQGSGSRLRREVHVHRIPAELNGARIVQALVDGERWDSLPFRASAGGTYTLMKRRWHEASLHRQWGKQAAIAWTVGLCNFYRDRAGLRLGIGDISHVVGEAMTDHGSHQLGRDVDVYVLDYPSGSIFPEAYFCDGTTTLSLTAMVPPTSTTGLYTPSGGTRLTGAHETEVWRRYATVLAYCFATWGMLNTFTWHGVRQIQADAVAIAQAAFDAGWRNTWGAAPKSRADLSPSASERARKLIGQGSSSYGPGKGWPPHRDHIHIRLNV
jgi:Penicillin-insensitive murein endopeptidase/Putative peptidoglycan binding domain